MLEMKATRTAAATAAVAGAALLSLAIISSFGSSGTSYSLLDDTASIRAVGDEGCLGRSCKMTDTAAKKDLTNFFDSFLGKGPHSGGKDEHVRRLERAQIAKPQSLKMKDKDAADDLDQYYDSLPGQKTDRVVHAEEVGKQHMPALAAADSRKDLDSYYDNLRTGGGRKETIIEAEEDAKREAADLHDQGVKRRENEEQHMLQVEASSVIQAKKDKHRFAQLDKAEREMQAQGHNMEAVPTKHLSAKESRETADEFFKELQTDVKKTPAVVHIEQESVAQAKLDMTKASQHLKQVLSPKVSGWLSSDEDRETANEFFDELQKTVNKTPRVLAAEARAKSEAVHDMRAASSETEHIINQANQPHRLSAKEAAAEQERYFRSLQTQVHKTKKVLAAESRARATAVNDMHYSAASGDAKRQDAAPAVGDRRISADEARKELDEAVDSFPVHKTQAVLRAEALAKAAASASREAATTAKNAIVAPTSLSAKQAEEQQEQFFSALGTKVHKTPSVLLAEQVAEAQAAKDREAVRAVDDRSVPPATPAVSGGRLSADAARKQLDAAVDAMPVHKAPLPHVKPAVGDARLSAEAARKELAAAIDAFPVHKTKAVKAAEAKALAAVKRRRQAHRASASGGSDVAPAGSTSLTGEQARRDLDAAVDAMPVHKVALPEVKPAVGDAKLSAHAARKALDKAIDAFPVDKVKSVLAAEARSAKEEAARTRDLAAEQEAPAPADESRARAAPLSGKQARADMDRAIDAMPVDKKALPHVAPAVGDTPLSADAARRKLDKAIDDIPVHKQALPHVAPAVGDERLSAGAARRRLDRAIDAMPVHKRALPHVAPAVGDERLSADAARAAMERDIDALPHARKRPLPHVAPAVGDAPLSAGAARRDLDQAVDALPAREHPLPHTAAAVGGPPLSAAAARADADRFFGSLPAASKALPHVAPAVGDKPLSGRKARRALDRALPAAVAPRHPRRPGATPAVAGIRLAAKEAWAAMNSFFDHLPAAKPALPHVKAAVANRPLTAGAARRELQDDLANLHHS